MKRFAVWVHWPSQEIVAIRALGTAWGEKMARLRADPDHTFATFYAEDELGAAIKAKQALAKIAKGENPGWRRVR